MKPGAPTLTPTPAQSLRQSLARTAAWLAAALLLGACSANPGDDDPDGIGGTGVDKAATRLGDDPDGIGGTGISGSITAFGSIIVGTQRIELPEDVTISRAKHPIAGDELRVGQVVRVLADGEAGALRAREIEIVDTLVGPVQRVDAVRSRLIVMEHDILVDERTRISTALDWRQLRRGQRVRVAGLRASAGRIFATRLEMAPHGEPDTVFGPLSQALPAIGHVHLRTVGRLRVRLPADIVQPPTPEVLAQLRGSLVDDEFIATSVSWHSQLPFEHRARRVFVEAMAEADSSTGDIKLGDRGLADPVGAHVAAGLAAQLRDGPVRVTLEGQVDSHGVISESNISPNKTRTAPARDQREPRAGTRSRADHRGRGPRGQDSASGSPGNDRSAPSPGGGDHGRGGGGRD